VIASIEEPEVIAQILAHLGRDEAAAGAIARANEWSGQERDERPRPGKVERVNSNHGQQGR